MSVFIITGSIALAFWYVKSVKTLTKSLTGHAKDMSSKKQEIAQEKQITENILYQMLPRHVAGKELSLFLEL